LSDATRRAEARAALRTSWRAAGWYPDLTIGEALRAGADARGDDVLTFAAVDGPTETTTLTALLSRASRLATGLARAGVEPGSVVAVQAPADRGSTEVLEALWLLGAVAVPLVLTATPSDLEHVIVDAGVTHIVAVSSWRDQSIATGAARIQSDRGAPAVFVIGDDAPTGTVPLTQLDCDGPAPEPPHSPASVATVLYTSGSTAAPKGVQHSHETLLAGLTAVPADASTRMLATFPAGHVASLLGLLRPLCAGGTTVVMDRWSGRRAAELVEEHRIDSSAGTPFFLATLLDEADAAGRDISTLRRFLVGAAAVPPALVRRAEERGIIAWRTYGSTEHPAISAGSPEDPAEKRSSTDGRIGAGNEVRLLDEAGNDVAKGEEGEIVARGPKQFLGYRNPALDRDAFTGTSWFRTGDLGRFDDDGYLIVTDRLKEIIIRGGENISTREVEDVLATHPHIGEVAVVGAPDEIWGERVCAFLVAKDGCVPTPAELVAHAVRAGLAQHKLPAQSVVVEALPRTPAGKVRKRDLRAIVVASASRGEEGQA
jgi:cyclohexanecarboxylate-CoA ligase